MSVRVEHRMSATGRVTNNLFITIALAIAVAGLVSAALGHPGSLGAAVLWSLAVASTASSVGWARSPPTT